MKLLQLLTDIHKANFITQQVDADCEIKTILEEYDCLIDSNVPEWFIQMLTAVYNNNPTTFRFTVGDPSLSSNAGSILLELQERLSWDVDDQGEWSEVRFPGYQLEAVLSFEGGGICKVSRVS